MEWLTSLFDAKIVLESDRRHYHQFDRTRILEQVISQAIDGPRNGSKSGS
jgi:hypothetical protein